MGLVYEDDLSIRPVLTIITPTIRPAGAIEVARSIQRAAPHPWEIRHIIAYWPEPPDRAFARTGQWMTRILRAAGERGQRVDEDVADDHPAHTLGRHRERGGDGGKRDVHGGVERDHERAGRRGPPDHGAYDGTACPIP